MTGEWVAVRTVWRLVDVGGHMVLETYPPGHVVGDWVERWGTYIRLGRVAKRTPR